MEETICFPFNPGRLSLGDAVIDRAKDILRNLENTELSPDGGTRYVSRQSAERETLPSIFRIRRPWHGVGATDGA